MDDASAAVAAAGVEVAGIVAADGHRSVPGEADIDRGSGTEAGTEDEAASEAGTGIDNGTDTADTSDTARVGNAAQTWAAVEEEAAGGKKRAALAPAAHRLHHGFSFRAKRQTLHWCPFWGMSANPQPKISDYLIIIYFKPTVKTSV